MAMGEPAIAVDPSGAIAAARRLVAPVLAGEPGAFERPVRDHHGLCWHVIDRVVRHPDDTRGLCQ